MAGPQSQVAVRLGQAAAEREPLHARPVLPVEAPEAPARPYTMDDHVADLIGLLDHLGLDRIVLCGLSVGGLIAQGIAARQPERVSALILCDTAARIGDDDLWNARIAAIEDDGIEALADPIMERWLSAAFRAEKPDEALAWRNMLVRTTVDGYVGTCAAIRDADRAASDTKVFGFHRAAGEPPGGIDCRGLAIRRRGPGSSRIRGAYTPAMDELGRIS